jgi:hypothetical protein
MPGSIFVDIVDISLDMNLKPLFIYMNINTPISILAQVRAEQANLSFSTGKPSTKTTKITLPIEAVEMAKTLNRSLAKQFTFLWSGRKHDTLAPAQMLEKVIHTISRLSAYCKVEHGGTGEGYPDPEDEFAGECLSVWIYEYHEMTARLSL